MSWQCGSCCVGVRDVIAVLVDVVTLMVQVAAHGLFCVGVGTVDVFAVLL